MLRRPVRRRPCAWPGALVVVLASAFVAAAGPGYSEDIEKRTLEGAHYREVLFTGPNLQLVVMKLDPLEEIGLETHEHGDQFIRVEAGSGEATLGGERVALKDGVAVVIPAGVAHNVVNTSRTEPLRLYVIYTPPAHEPGTLHHTREQAEEH